MLEIRTVALVTALTAFGCGTVKNVTVRPDFDQVDKRTLLRLAVLTAPLPAGDPSVGAMWSSMARRYANHHRDFIAKEELAEAELPASLCPEGMDGVLHLEPSLEATEGGAEVGVIGRLVRCRDQVVVWSAMAGGSWASDDENVSTVISQYVDEHGEGVRPWVAPSFHALRALLDTLPRPVLEKEDDIMEKIELGE